MIQRRLGNTEVHVSQFGLGCNRIGEPQLSEKEWISLLHRSAEEGVTYYDTAAMYTKGRSEEILGKAFGKRNDIIIATKVTPLRDSTHSPYPSSHIIDETEKSLRRLKRDQIDILQTHGAELEDGPFDDRAAETLMKLREQGKIRFRGASLNNVKAGIHACERRSVDMMQITYNILSHDMVLSLLDMARKHGVGIVARKPLQRGVLTGKYASVDDVPSEARALIERKNLTFQIKATANLKGQLNIPSHKLIEMALHFPLTHPAVCSVIFGIRNEAQFFENISAARSLSLSQKEVDQLKRFRQSLCF